MDIRQFIIVAFCVGLSACQSSSGPTSESGEITAGLGSQYEDLQLVSNLPPPDNTNQGRDVPVARDDLLEVDVFEVDELDRTARVDSNGRISLALIGMVDAAGKTIPELEGEIERLYGVRYLQNPEVSVFVKESAGQQVTVHGAVKKPGLYQASSTATLLQVVAQAGGFEEIADDTKLYVFRQVDGRKLVANYNVKQIRSGQRPDPRIFGGDVVVSFSSGTKVAMKNLRETLGIASSVARIAAF